METVFEKPSRRNSIAVCLFECNACLLGGTKTIAVAVRNVGRTSMFVCVSEEIWYTELVEVSGRIIMPKKIENTFKSIT